MARDLFQTPHTDLHQQPSPTTIYNQQRRRLHRALLPGIGLAHDPLGTTTNPNEALSQANPKAWTNRSTAPSRVATRDAFRPKSTPPCESSPTNRHRHKICGCSRNDSKHHVTDKITTGHPRTQQ